MYRFETKSVEGFIQQLAVSYVAKGYWFYVAGSIPEGKEPGRTDAKLIAKYDVDISKWTRVRRKRQGKATLQYLRFHRFFVLLATLGKHRFYMQESVIWDIRKRPIRFAGYSVSCKMGRDGKWHPLVRIDALEFKMIKRHFLKAALTTSTEVLAGILWGLRFVPYAPVRAQYRHLFHAVNERRRLASLEPLPWDILPNKRWIVRPFV
jgi:hypothetical protein